MSACPECHTIKTRVIDSRPLTNGWTQRMRECGCGTRWHTFEVPTALCEFAPSELGSVIVNRKKKKR